MINEKSILLIYTGCGKWSQNLRGLIKAKKCKEMCFYFLNVIIMTFTFILFSVVNMKWMGEYRAFIVEAFIKNNESIIATERALQAW